MFIYIHIYMYTHKKGLGFRASSRESGNILYGIIVLATLADSRLITIKWGRCTSYLLGLLARSGKTLDNELKTGTTDVVVYSIICRRLSEQGKVVGQVLRYRHMTKDGENNKSCSGFNCLWFSRLLRTELQLFRA